MNDLNPETVQKININQQVQEQGSCKDTLALWG